ncbi:hypothetical protein GCM10008171_32600 [Methylopila jiangsuensis]|uniref:Uncharacterized protein n=1 Tax=Methylopila jiangsuensis TaxID=586230 RepID=A0A9W6JKD3_9HYPH|nr:hypothetical protein GCM10008171_32600 [Methylopila jiangsuensis]
MLMRDCERREHENRFASVLADDAAPLDRAERFTEARVKKQSGATGAKREINRVPLMIEHVGMKRRHFRKPAWKGLDALAAYEVVIAVERGHGRRSDWCWQDECLTSPTATTGAQNASQIAMMQAVAFALILPPSVRGRGRGAAA